MLTPTSPTTLADYNAAILGDNSTHVRIVFPVQNVTFGDSDISAEGGVTLTQILNPDTDLVMGKAVASQVVIRFLNNGQFTGFNWTEEFRVDFGVEISGSIEWVTVGYFTGKKPERVKMVETIEFTAIDRMSKFDTLADDFLSTLVYPRTMSQIYSALCTYIGVSKATGDENSTVMSTSFSASPFTSGITCRALLAYIAEANCCYAKITSAGKVKLVWFSDQTSNYSIDGDDYFAINLDEATVPVIDSVRISDTQNDGNGFIYPVGTNDVVYQIVDNPLLLAMTTAQKQTVIKNIVTRFTAIGAYTPLAVNAIGNWMVETGDIIEIGYDSQTVNMLVFSRTMQWNGGCNDTYECTGETERTEISESAKQKYVIGGELSNKYTIQSGVDITDQGVTVSGGKFIKLISGGVLDVQSTNFLIDSDNKKIEMTGGSFKIVSNTLEMSSSNMIVSNQYGYIETKVPSGTGAVIIGNYADPIKDVNVIVNTDVSRGEGGLTLRKRTSSRNDYVSEIALGKAEVQRGGSTVEIAYTAFKSTVYNSNGTVKYSSNGDLLAENLMIDNIYGKDIIIEKSSNPVIIKATNSTTGLDVNLEIGTAGRNHGIYSNGYVDSSNAFHSDAKWLIYRDASNNTIVNGYATDDVHLAGTQTITGSKTFEGSVYVRNNSNNPYIAFRGAGNSNTSALIYALGCGNGSGVYGRPYFQFRESSPTSDGTGLAGGYDAFSLPRVTAGQTTTNSYDILTTKDFPFARVTGFSPGGTTAGDGTNKITFTAPEASRQCIILFADKMTNLYCNSLSGSTVYSGDLPSGWTLTKSNATYTLTRNATQAFKYTILWI